MSYPVRSPHTGHQSLAVTTVISNSLTIGQFLRKAPRTTGSILGLFLLCNVFILQAVFDKRDGIVSDPSGGGTEFFITLRKYFVRKNNEWRVASTRTPKNIFEPKSKLNALPITEKSIANDSLLSCALVSSLERFEFVASGFTKSAYRAVINNNGQIVAVKTVNPQGHDVAECLKKHPNELDSTKALPECYMLASSKILKEIYLLSKLNHPNVIKMIGYCIPHKRFMDKQTTVAIITELGELVDIIKLLQMSWEDRLKLSLDLARLVQFFSTQEGGPLRISDFRRQQFVLVDGHLKLSDVDDVTRGDIPCQSDYDCVLRLMVSNKNQKGDSGTVEVPCDHGVCVGLSDKSNMVQAGRHFVNFILPHATPTGLEEEATLIAKSFSSGLWNSTYLLKRTEDLLRTFALGTYRKSSNSSLIHSYKYERLLNKDLPGLFDYDCRQSLTGKTSCSQSVSGVEEATETCSLDPRCKSFILTNETTWSGRRIVHYKNNFTNPTRKDGTVLYVKKLND